MHAISKFQPQADKRNDYRYLRCSMRGVQKSHHTSSPVSAFVWVEGYFLDASLISPLI